MTVDWNQRTVRSPQIGVLDLKIIRGLCLDAVQVQKIGLNEQHYIYLL